MKISTGINIKNSFKRVFAIILAVVICFAVMPAAFAAGARGDINKDGKTNSSDALLVLRNAVGYSDAEFDEYRADLNNDGVVNSSDALRVLQISVGLDNPTTYSKNEALKFYADAFDSLSTGNVKVSYKSRYVSKAVNDKNSKDYVEIDEHNDELAVTYENGYNKSMGLISEFCPDTRIDPSLVKSATVTKNDTSSYTVKIVLVADNADFKDYIPHKTYPYLLNYADCSVSAFENYYATSGTASFPASEITAVVKDGYIKELTVTVPFEMKMHLSSEDKKKSMDVTEKGTVSDVYSFTF